MSSNNMREPAAGARFQSNDKTGHED
jgi:hypothetical protein